MIGSIQQRKRRVSWPWHKNKQINFIAHSAFNGWLTTSKEQLKIQYGSVLAYSRKKLVYLRPAEKRNCSDLDVHNYGR